MTAAIPTYCLSKRILCVQESEEDRTLLDELLRGHEIVFARNANEAFPELHRAPFDAYILDYWLPDWTGPQLCREIRQLDQHAPVLFYTAAVAENARKRAINAGCNAYLSKPVEPSRLIGQLRTLLELSDLESIRARVEENRAVQDELERRISEVLKRTDQARQFALRAIERTSRAKAALAFAQSHGTQANFERW